MDQRHQQMVWKRSARCSSGACLEVSGAGEYHLVRDSKAGDAGPILSFASASWREFLTAVQADEFRIC